MRAQKRDANEAEIVEYLEACGYMVERCYTPMPFDLLVGRQTGPLRLPLEVKGPRGTLTEAQETFFRDYPYLVVRTIEDAYQACQRWL